jgi:hypothetical protein
MSSFYPVLLPHGRPDLEEILSRDARVRPSVVASQRYKPTPPIWTTQQTLERLSGRICTAVPIRMRCVRAAIALATVSGADSRDRVGFMRISANQTRSSPSAPPPRSARRPRSASPPRPTETRGNFQIPPATSCCPVRPPRTAPPPIAIVRPKPAHGNADTRPGPPHPHRYGQAEVPGPDRRSPGHPCDAGTAIDGRVRPGHDGRRGRHNAAERNNQSGCPGLAREAI